jgi:hypothetical protein
MIGTWDALTLTLSQKEREAYRLSFWERVRVRASPATNVSTRHCGDTTW